MPYSSEEGKAWTKRLIQRISPATIVDVGPGSGTYSDLARTKTAQWTGIEIFEPYVARFGLHDKYDKVIIGDVRSVDLPTADLYILGDVVEHFTFGDALDVLARVWSVTDHLIVSVPIVTWEQGATDGNEHEAHLYHWTVETMIATLAPDQWWTGSQVGVFYKKLSTEQFV